MPWSFRLVSRDWLGYLQKWHQSEPSCCVKVRWSIRFLNTATLFSTLIDLISLLLMQPTHFTWRHVGWFIWFFSGSKFSMYIPSYKQLKRQAPPTNAFSGDPRPRARLSPTSRYRCSLSARCGKVVRVFCSSALHHGHPIVALMATAADFVSGLLILTTFRIGGSAWLVTSVRLWSSTLMMDSSTPPYSWYSTTGDLAKLLFSH